METKVAIVTGGSRGIGFGISSALAREGAVVIIASKNKKRGMAARNTLADRGLTANFVVTDVTDKKQVEWMVSEVIKVHGTIDVLVNNAGIHERAPFCEETEDLWMRIYRTNVLGTTLPSQAVVRHMIEKNKGSIVNMGSKSGVVGKPGHVAYCASKGAVISMTRSMAVELAPYGSTPYAPAQWKRTCTSQTCLPRSSRRRSLSPRPSNGRDSRKISERSPFTSPLTRAAGAQARQSA